MKGDLKFLIVGLGSMGKRRVRNLQALGEKEVIGFDLREDRRKEAGEKYGVKTFGDFEEALKQKPNVMIISTPPDLHIRYAKIAAEKGMHFFMEASVVDEGMDELIRMCKGKDIVAAPSATFRFYYPVKIIKKLIDEGTIGKPLSFTYQSGQYLPDWHPWEDYRKFYVSKKATGACREIVPFELSWITWVFGDVKEVSGLRGKLSKLENDIDDIYHLLLRFKSGMFGHLTVDVISRTPTRMMRIISEDGTIVWDWEKKNVMAYTAKNKEWKTYSWEQESVEKNYVTAEDMYIDEMRHLLNSIRGKEKYFYSLEDDRRNLGLLYASEESSDKGAHIKV
ncbi:MAG: Gfo/Idh/MocA family oxidoreductase [Candidatus Altiarchaeota archaeon]|nr:Gfo/Idh/MocA family oxidoreductase [Candidatus Altiarchaeota archaeon]